MFSDSWVNSGAGGSMMIGAPLPPRFGAGTGFPGADLLGADLAVAAFAGAGIASDGLPVFVAGAGLALLAGCSSAGALWAGASAFAWVAWVAPGALFSADNGTGISTRPAAEADGEVSTGLT